MELDKSFWNIILLGIAFLFLVTTSLTGTAIQEVVVASVNRDYIDSWEGSQWNAYNSLGAMNLVLFVCGWFSPSLIAFLGPKRSILLGGMCICLAFSVFLYPFKYGLLMFSVVLGFGNPVIWSSQGNYLTIMSTESNITRNTGILWSLCQSSLVVGNFLVAYLFKGQEEISKETRIATYSALLAMGGVGIILSLFLRGVGKAEVSEVPKSPFQAFRNSMKLMGTKKMILLCITFFYTGLEVTFFSGVYSASIAFTKSFGTERKQNSGESGVMIGLGEVVGGLCFILSAGRKSTRFIITGAYLLFLLSFSLIYINLPVHASLYETDEKALIHSNLPIALVCAFLLGFSDACFETQLYQFIAINYTEDSSPPFAIYQSIQAIAMGSIASIGTLAFLAADRLSREDEALADRANEKPPIAISQRASISSQFSKTLVGIPGKDQSSRPPVISVDIVG